VIRYTLTCDQKHHFESWFQSSAAYDSLAASGHLSCSVSSVPAKGNTKDVKPDLSKPQSDVETAMEKLRKDVEARKMHDGDAPERAIYGEAKLDDAKKLIEDGVPVAPLPFMPKRKTN